MKSMQLYFSLCSFLIVSALTADIYQYDDCDADGTLFLTAAEPDAYVNLSNLYLGCADLEDAFLYQANISNSDLNHANLYSTWFSSSTLISTDFSYADISNGYFRFANAQNSTFANANLNQSDFGGCDLTGANLSYANLYNSSMGSVVLTDAIARHANISTGNNEYGVYMKYSTLINTDFSYANLNAVQLDGSEIDGSVLHQVVANNAQLAASAIYSTDFTDAMLAGINFTGSTITFSDFSHADLSGSNFSGTTLQSVYFTNADLSNSFFRPDTHFYVYVTNANLSDADVSSVDLRGLLGWSSAIWNRATYNSSTIFPKGMDPDQLGMRHVETSLRVEPDSEYFFHTIQEAIDFIGENAWVVEPVEIIIAPGIYTGQSGLLEVVDTQGHSLWIHGEGETSEIILDGGSQRSVISDEVVAGENHLLIIENVTIKHGFDNFGGGMWTNNSDVQIINCHFENNVSIEYGGGLYIENATPIIEGCTFKNNSSAYGGAIHSFESNPTLRDTIVCGNTPNQIDGNWIDGGGNTIANECPVDCPDISGDGLVNVNDLLAIIDQWGLANSPADVNFDGIVDVTDLLIVVGSWGECE
ncbi:MAG: hypothetical protein CMJ26_00300 [Phycisphaerae bacterium]|nr:hypothetical protein [Phycisphaerae bacterium]